MIYLPGLKFVFIHVPKTGGMSIRKSLGVSPKNLGPIPPGERYEFIHMTATMAQTYLPDWEDHNSAAFVRNPWDRMVSMWAQLPKDRWSFDDFLESDLIHDCFLRPQVDYLDGIKFIGRFEQLEDDYVIMCNIAGLVPHHLAYENRSEHRKYRDYYTDRTRDIVGDRYHQDIERFGYSF